MSIEDGYAERVVGVLREYFPADLSDLAAQIITEATEHQVRDPQSSFEVIVDSPYAANWRLKARSEDRRQVRLACFRVTRRDSDAQFERTVNDALAAVEGGR